MTKRAPCMKKRPPLRAVLGLALILCLCGASASADFLRIDGLSMSDTLADGQIVLTTMDTYGTVWHCFPWQSAEEQEQCRREIVGGDPARFDIVVCHYPRRGAVSFVKRVVGLPGDTVELRDGFLYVNGERFDEPYINDEYRTGMGAAFAPTRVPKRGDTVTLRDGVFTAEGEAYGFGFTLLRVTDGSGEWTLRKASDPAGSGMWLWKDGERYLLRAGVWYREFPAEGTSAGEPLETVTERYPGEPSGTVTLIRCAGSPMPDGNYTVAEDCYFLLGDRRNNANDSRTIGALERSRIISQVILPQ